MRIANQFLRFSAIGTLGFFIDVAVLYGMHNIGLDLYSARLVSFVVAATATWLGNRSFTFGTRRRSTVRVPREYGAYLAAMAMGGLVNYGIYALLITWLEFFRQQPWLAVVGGTSVGLLINFATARKVLYQPRN